MVYQGFSIFIRFYSQHVAANIFTFAATAMMNFCKVKLKYFSAPAAFITILLITVLFAADIQAQVKSSTPVKNSTKKDTLQIPGSIKQTTAQRPNANVSDSIMFVKADTIYNMDTVNLSPGQQLDSPIIPIVRTDTFNVKVSKDSLDAPIFYHAEDSMVMEVPQKRIILYGKQTNAKYLDNELTSPGIVYDQKNNMITAVHKRDSTGKVIASPTFKQGELMTVSDSIAFSPKSGKGLSKGTYTKQDEMFIYGERIKKIDSSSFYAYRARITTCNLDTPHFAFVSKKIKFINQKFAVTGPVHPEFEGVPIPVVLPFGIYPMFQGRHSGLIAPQFTSNDQYGLALENLGYYKVINDNWDVTARGTFYSYGGWTLALSPRYYRRYRYTGNFNIDIQRLKIGFKGDPDYSLNKSFKVRWTHSMDSKARPGVTFSANVDAGSTSFDRNTPNNPVRNFNNILTSSINYSKVWKDKPFNLSLQANHTQNSNTKLVNITLPSANFNLNTIYPLRRKDAAGSLKWYENIGIALNTVLLNQTSFYDVSDEDTINSKLRDSRPVFTQITQNMLWGVRHSVPITLALPSLGPVQISPGVSYNETWYQRKVSYSWNEAAKKLDTTATKGLYTAREMSFSLSASSRIFGMFTFGKNSKIKALRHEIRPTFSFSYKPDMNGKFFRSVQTDSLLNFRQYNIYEGNINGAYGAGEFGGISFGIDNNLQMKVRDKKDTSETADKKITLLDGLALNGSYNFLADSFQLSTFNISARSNLFNKINITVSGSLDPYQYDSTRRINRLVWKDKLVTLGRLSSANISLSTSFRGGDQKAQTQKSQSLSNAVNPYTGMPLTEEQQEAAYISNNPADYTDFSIPWSIQVGMSFRYQNSFSALRKGFVSTTSADMNAGGTLALTPKWQISLNGNYNFSTKEVGMVTMSISREMHCWQMSISITPVGRYKFFSVIISPKSALLRDIKVNRTRYFYDL